MRKYLALIPALTIVAVAFAACGDDDDGDRLSATEYFAQADQLEADLGAVFEQDRSSAREFIDAFSTEAADYSDAYDDLTPPEEIEDTHDERVEAIDEAISAIEEAGEDFTEDDPPDVVFEIFELPEVARLEELDCDLKEFADEEGVETTLCPDEEESIDPSTLPAEESTEVLIEDFSFQPAHIQVSVGDTVTWTQGADGAPHTATADDGSFDSGLLEDEGATFEFTFEAAGEFSYLCTVHPEMLGLVTVSE